MILKKLTRIKVLIVFGTRPEAIKIAPLVLKMKENPDLIDLKVCVTGQHREMLDQVLEIFEIVPDVDLDIMKPGQDLVDVNAIVLTKMRNVLTELTPDIVLVHGDTTTTLATALASFYEGIKIGHIEAGLRTHNMQSPFPEEFNRQAVSKIASIHFAPTNHCEQNLLLEKIDPNSIFVTGNTAIDALQWTLNRLESDVELRAPLEIKLNKQLNFAWDLEPFVLVTAHRRENFGSGMLEICTALSELCAIYPKKHFIYPVHLNPNVQKPVHAILGGLTNVHLIEPLDYLTFSMLLQKCFFVLTDSGGLQEEAPSLGKPVLLMRDTTERPEAIEAGTLALVGADKIKIVESVVRMFEDRNFYESMATARNPFGSGDAADKIVKSLFEFLSQ